MARTKTTLIDPDVQLLQALAHPTRLSIVRELTGGGRSAPATSRRCCDVSQPTVSHHLRILKEAGRDRGRAARDVDLYPIVPAPRIACGPSPASSSALPP